MFNERTYKINWKQWYLVDFINLFYVVCIKTYISTRPLYDLFLKFPVFFFLHLVWFVFLVLKKGINLPKDTNFTVSIQILIYVDTFLNIKILVSLKKGFKTGIKFFF